MDQVAISAVFMRGGTSKGLIFQRKHLPADTGAWAPIFLAALGSPDPNGRQLDGMGGGLSSLSKVCIIEPSQRDDADVDYTFAQVDVREARVDFRSMCGSLSSAVGPFAVDEGLVAAPRDGKATVRIHNTNTKRLIRSTFPVSGGRAAVEGPHGMDGVSGTGAPIRVTFLAPAGGATGSLLPTGSVADRIDIPNLGSVEFSFVDTGNPVMFVAAEAVGASGTEMPPEIDSAPGLLARLETIRRHVCVSIGAAPDLAQAAHVATPRIAIVSPMADAPTLSGHALKRTDADIMVRMISRGQPHRAVTVTAALSLAVATRLPGSLPNRMLPEGAGRSREVRIGHPSGVWVMTAEVRQTAAGFDAEYAGIDLTARRLFQGEVLVPASRLESVSLGK